MYPNQGNHDGFRTIVFQKAVIFLFFNGPQQ